MDSKKLQALQQANSHLAPQTKPPTLQHHDFRPSRSPVFQNYPQYQSLASNFAQINMTNNPQEQLLHKAAMQQSAQLGYHDQIYQSTNAHQSRLANHFPGVHQHPTSNLRLQQQFHALEQEKMQQQIRTHASAADVRNAKTNESAYVEFPQSDVVDDKHVVVEQRATSHTTAAAAATEQQQPDDATVEFESLQSISARTGVADED
jgi:hypothetical protein